MEPIMLKIIQKNCQDIKGIYVDKETAMMKLEELHNRGYTDLDIVRTPYLSCVDVGKEE